jgi:uncharacterized protein
MKPPPPQPLELVPGAVADARRAVWLPAARTLVVADTHLGYAWAQRTRGQLLPVGAPDDTVARLAELRAEYRPARLVILGDVVHAAVAVEPLRAALGELVARLAGETELALCLGNHDRRLERRLAEWGLPLRTVPELTVGPWRLLHGDVWPPIPAAAVAAGAEPPRVLLGHEHPCLVLGDGVASRARVPCFVVGAQGVILPAFSQWAAGSALGVRPWLGPVAAALRFHEAVACLGPRLLRVPLGPGGRPRLPGHASLA